jgi:hypothetical protein
LRLNALHHPLFEFPAGHLPGIELPGKFISGYLRILANLVSQPECLGQGKMASVENCMRSSGFFMLATGATPRERLFPLAVIIISALFANVTVTPLFFSNKLKAAIFVLKNHIELLRCYLFKK